MVFGCRRRCLRLSCGSASPTLATRAMYREHREVPSRLPMDVMQLIGKWIAPLVRISVAALGWVRWPTLLSKSRCQDWNAVAPSRVKVGGYWAGLRRFAWTQTSRKRWQLKGRRGCAQTQRGRIYSCNEKTLFPSSTRFSSAAVDQSRPPIPTQKHTWKEVTSVIVQRCQSSC